MRRVVITGASAGLGRAAAREFGKCGDAIGLIARDVERLDDAKAEIEAAGGRAIALPADVADAAAVRAAADHAARELGGIDVWVNCAMATVFAPFHEMTPDEYRRVTEVTYLGYVHGTMAALAHMRPRNAGTIVQVGSALAYRAIPLQAAYCGAKFAIRGFTDALRSELIHEGSGIRISMVQMPALNTPQFDWGRNKLARRPQPLPPIFQPEMGAAAILRAARAAPRELWVGGSAVKAILGTMIAPGLLDRLLARKAYRGQMSEEAPTPGAPDNLFAPLAGRAIDAHGRFDGRAQGEAVAVIDPAAARRTLAACLLAALSAALLCRGGRARRR